MIAGFTGKHGAIVGLTRSAFRVERQERRERIKSGLRLLVAVASLMQRECEGQGVIDGVAESSFRAMRRNGSLERREGLIRMPLRELDSREQTERIGGIWMLSKRCTRSSKVTAGSFLASGIEPGQGRRGGNTKGEAAFLANLVGVCFDHDTLGARRERDPK